MKGGTKMTEEAIKVQKEKIYLGPISGEGTDAREFLMKGINEPGDVPIYYIDGLSISQKEMERFIAAIEENGLLEPEYDPESLVKDNAPLYRPKELDHVYRIPAVFSELSNRRDGEDFVSRQFAYVMWDDEPGRFEIRDWHEYMLPLEGVSFDLDEIRNIYSMYTGKPVRSKAERPGKAR